MTEPKDRDAPPPWLPAPYEDADAAALQALAQGRATADQQKRALTWVVERCCDTYGLSYRPGTDGARDTAFAEGKRFPGLQIVKLTKLKLGSLEPSPMRRKMA